VQYLCVSYSLHSGMDTIKVIVSRRTPEIETTNELSYTSNRLSALPSYLSSMEFIKT
jgi:hypothetical protein